MIFENGAQDGAWYLTEATGKPYYLGFTRMCTSCSPIRSHLGPIPPTPLSRHHPIRARTAEIFFLLLFFVVFHLDAKNATPFHRTVGSPSWVVARSDGNLLPPGLKDFGRWAVIGLFIFTGLNFLNVFNTILKAVGLGK
jgi:hypothetical protein